jgi:hypothetical protein
MVETCVAMFTTSNLEEVMRIRTAVPLIGVLFLADGTNVSGSEFTDVAVLLGRYPHDDELVTPLLSLLGRRSRDMTQCTFTLCFLDAAYSSH